MIDMESMIAYIERRRYKQVWETAFGIICFGLLALNIGYCIFDNE